MDCHIETRDGDELLWWGDVDGLVAHRAMALPAREDGIVVMDWSHPPPSVEEWHPSRTSRGSGRTGARSGRLSFPPALARSRAPGSSGVTKRSSGCCAYAAELDPETGAVRYMWFTK